MSTNQMVGNTKHRYWTDGTRKKDNDPEYKNSNWMKGISLTRDPRYAARWGSAVISLDRNLLAQRYPIIPYNWGFSIPDVTEHKREREEFLVTHRGGSYQNDEDGEMDWKMFKTPQGAVTNLDRYLTGIWLENEVDGRTSSYTRNLLERYGYPVEKVMEHPKFKGFYTNPN